MVQLLYGLDLCGAATLFIAGKTDFMDELRGLLYLGKKLLQHLPGYFRDLDAGVEYLGDFSSRDLASLRK